MSQSRTWCRMQASYWRTGDETFLLLGADVLRDMGMGDEEIPLWLDVTRRAREFLGEPGRICRGFLEFAGLEVDEEGR